jgi:hypothetical protein
MARNPEIQAKAQAELDAVVGAHRLPAYADRVHLPYVDALCKEVGVGNCLKSIYSLLMQVFRYHPVGPMGKPHLNSSTCFLTEDRRTPPRNGG